MRRRPDIRSRRVAFADSDSWWTYVCELTLDDGTVLFGKGDTRLTARARARMKFWARRRLDGKRP